MTENRVKILEEFCSIVERGELLGHRSTADEIINVHRVDQQYAVVHFSKNKRLVYKIEWIGSLAGMDARAFQWNRDNYPSELSGKRW